MHLLIAAKNNQTDIFKKLLAKTNIKELHTVNAKENQKNILHYIVQHKNVEMLKALLNKHPGTVKVLLQKPDNTQLVPLVDILKSDNWEIFNLLISYNDFFESIISYKDTNKLTLIAYILLEQKIDFLNSIKTKLEKNINKYISQLQLAAFDGQVDIFKQLTGNEAELFVYPSPLQIAASSNHFKLFEYLFTQFNWPLEQICGALATAITKNREAITSYVLMNIGKQNYELPDIARKLPCEISDTLEEALTSIQAKKTNDAAYSLFWLGVTYIKNRFYWLAAEAFYNSLSYYAKAQNLNGTSIQLDNLINLSTALLEEISLKETDILTAFITRLNIIKKLPKETLLGNCQRISFFNLTSQCYEERANENRMLADEAILKNDFAKAIELLNEAQNLYKKIGNTREKNLVLNILKLTAFQYAKSLTFNVNNLINIGKIEEAMKLLVTIEHLYALAEHKHHQAYTLVYMAKLAADIDTKNLYLLSALNLYNEILNKEPENFSIENNISNIKNMLNNAECLSII